MLCTISGCSLTPIGDIIRDVKGMRSKKFRSSEDARRVFDEGYGSMQSFAHAAEEKLALGSYPTSMMHAKFVCAIDEAVCKVLEALN